MKRTWPVLLFLSFAFISASCCVVNADRAVRGSGRVSEKVHKLSGISGVELATIGNLYIEKGRREELRVKADENLHEYLEIDVSGGKLEIKSERGVDLRPRKEMSFYLTVRELDEIVLSGCGDIEAPDLEGERIKVAIKGSGTIKAGDLRADEIVLRLTGSGDLSVGEGKADEIGIYISGSGDIDVDNIEARSSELKISGSGDAFVSRGTVTKQTVVITGSGDCKAGRLRCSRADVVITGSGSATIRVEDDLNAKISGSGDVRYYGRPRVHGSFSGSGDLKRI